ncbi:MAG: hypothetical protein M0038_13460, partial [Pseudomonadota bacterium]|nr:hypothetical protein [Pseudomonadota bacterium]
MGDRAILVSEVGLRDGLQSIQSIVPTHVKKEWIRAEAAAGVREIEVGSFVPSKVLPQLADTAELVRFAATIPGLTVAGFPTSNRWERCPCPTGMIEDDGNRRDTQAEEEECLFFVALSRARDRLLISHA